MKKALLKRALEALEDCSVTINQFRVRNNLIAEPQFLELRKEIEAKLGTPSSHWHAAGEPDPHGDSYDCERSKLALGKLTDDELANAAFMNYDHFPPLQDIIDGKAHSPIAYMTAVKERIRWLSRKLEAEPVAIIGPTYQLLWTGKGHMTEGLKIGDKLYHRANKRD